MDTDEQSQGIHQDITADQNSERDLTRLFGPDITEQSSLLDAAELNLTDEMTQVIAEGIRYLKSRRKDPGQQKEWINAQPHGTRLLLCLWIKDMDLISRITDG